MKNWMKTAFLIILIKRCFNLIDLAMPPWHLIHHLPSPVKKKIDPYLDRWNLLPQLSRRIFQNIAIGLAITLFVVLFHNFEPIRKVEEAALDWMIQMYRGTSPSKNAIPFTFIDIDEATYLTWGEPMVTPRDKLLKLIQYANSGKPSAIVVDIDLSRNAGSYDSILDDFIANYGGALDSSKKGGAEYAPILLIRTFRSNKHQGGTNLLEQRPSFLDNAVKDNPKIFWASSLFDLEKDRTIRKWRLWELSCIHGKGNIIPSVQLLTYCLLNKDKSITKNLLAELEKRAPSDCHEAMIASPEDGAETEVSIGKITINVNPTELNRRIFYEIPWNLNPGETRPIVSHLNRPVPLISIRSASVITESHQPINSNWLQGQIVVIGASFEDTRDLYPTPIGEMPGALIIINAIHSLLTYGEINPPPLWLKLMLQVLLILLMSITFAQFNSFWGKTISSSVIIISILPLSFVLFRSGIWLDYAIPLLVVQLNQMAHEFDDFRQKIATR